jgi:hypothetical protein
MPRRYPQTRGVASALRYWLVKAYDCNGFFVGAELLASWRAAELLALERSWDGFCLVRHDAANSLRTMAWYKAGKRLFLKPLDCE